MASTTYRPEIDGLRAIAVLAVIAAHAGVPSLHGGILGVDIFFVISGYLITGILQREFRSGTFSLLGFYDRRMRRILPALYVMMLLCTPVAFLLMLPGNLENYGQSLVATVLFANNILLLLTAGYFDLESKLKPLLHTWSLGVEEQYYVFAPLLMWASYRLLRDKGLLVFACVMTLASFIVSLWLSGARPNANFYLVFSRAWELGAGAIVALIEPRLRAASGPSDGRRETFTLIGLIGLLASIVLTNPSKSMPNWHTLVPVLSTCAVLAYGSREGIAGRMLSAGPVVFIGLLSYSAYLYHQPVLVFARLSSFSEPPLWLMLSLCVLVFGMAYLSWRFIETPFRDRRRISFPRALAFAAVPSVLIVGVGLSMYFSSGFQARWPELAAKDPHFGPQQNKIYNSEPGQFRGVALPDAADRKRVLVIGNSFARDFLNMGLEAGAFKPGYLSYSESSDCVPITPALKQLTRNADLIVWATDLEVDRVPCVRDRVAELDALRPGITLVLGTKSFGWNNNAVMLLPSNERYVYRTRPLPEVEAADKLAAATFGKRFIPVISHIQDGQGAVPVFTPEKMFISQDTRHLTKAGAQYLGKLVFADPRLQS